MSSILQSPRFLPRVMALDAASCLLTGTVQLAWTQPLAQLTGLPPALLTATGAFLLLYAALAAWLARRQPLLRPLIGLVVLGNFGWALGCMALVFTGLWPLTGLGMAWLIAQALTVLLLGEAQWMGLRATRHWAAGATA